MIPYPAGNVNRAKSFVFNNGFCSPLGRAFPASSLPNFEKRTYFIEFSTEFVSPLFSIFILFFFFFLFIYPWRYPIAIHLCFHRLSKTKHETNITKTFSKHSGNSQKQQKNFVLIPYEHTKRESTKSCRLHFCVNHLYKNVQKCKLQICVDYTKLYKSLNMKCSAQS
jgi:hypothetical protein